MRASGLFVVFTSSVLFTSVLRAKEPEAIAAGIGSTIDIAGFVECLDGPTAAIAAGCSTANFHPDTHIDLLDVAVAQRGYLLNPGPIQLGVETAGEIDPVDDVDEYTFFGTFGISATVDFSTPLVNNRPDLVVRLDLIRPNGSTAFTVPSCGMTTRIDNATLDATGTWKVRVRAYESFAACGFGADEALRTGLYTLTVCTSNTVPIPIAYGQTKSAAFLADCQIVNFQFTGSVDDVVMVMYLGPAIARRLQLYAPNGSLLATSGGGAGTSLSDIRLPLDGMYRLAVEAQDGQSTGSFSISLTELGNAVPIAFKTPSDGEISLVAEVDSYSFPGTFGTAVTIDYSTLLVANRPDLVPRVDLVRPNGTTAASVPSCGSTTRIDNAILDATGTWTVRVRAYESWFACGFGPDNGLLTGDYTLTVCVSNGVPIPIAYGETKAGNFAADCQIVNYEFVGSLDDVVTVMYLGPAITRRMLLYAPNGALLATSGGGAGASLTDIRLPLTGAYRIAVEAADGQTIGDFSIGLSELADALPIAFNFATPGQLTQVADADIYFFEGSFGETVTVDYVTPTVATRPDLVPRIDLIRPNGTTAATVPSCGTTTRIDNAILDATGTWTVRVRAYESWFACGFGADLALITGGYTLTVCGSEADPVLIAYGETKSGDLDVDCHVNNFQFQGAVGDVVTVMYLGPAVTRRIQLFAPNGSLLGTSGGGAGATLTDVVLPLNGVYRIRIEASDNQPTGEFSLGLSELDDAVPVAFNTPITTNLSQIAGADTYSFDGTFGTSVTVDFTTPLVKNRPDLTVRLDLVRPNGTVAASVPSCGTTARIDTAAIDATGTWTVRVRAYESWFACGLGLDAGLLTGDYTLNVCTSNADPIPIAYGETKNGSFAADCQIVNYGFQGSLGDVVSLMYAGPAVTRRVQLFAPNGTLLTSSGGGSCPTLADVLLPLNGQYRIAVEAADGQAIGDFSIGLNNLPNPIAITINTPKAAAISQGGEADVYSFAGASGQQITVNYVTPSVGAAPDLPVRLELVRPSGTVASSTVSCGTTARLQSVTPDATGTWLVRVRAYESWCSCGFGLDRNLTTGDYTVTVCNQVNCPP